MLHLDPVLKSCIGALGGALATWLAARYGRKVIVQVRSGDREVKIEAETTKQAERMLTAVEYYQKENKL